MNSILYRQASSAERPRPKLSFEKNENVRIIDGPFTNFSGKVDEVNPELREKYHKEPMLSTKVDPALLGVLALASVGDVNNPIITIQNTAGATLPHNAASSSPVLQALERPQSAARSHIA